MKNGLCIDTSNQPMSIALYKDGAMAAEMTINIRRNHSIQLMPNIEHLMNQIDLKPNELDQIVVAEGPGSFTGIRIGMTTAKTLAWSLNIPIKTVSSLELVASSLLYHSGLVSPFFDARRGNVYTGLYRVTEGHIERVEDDCNIDMTSWLEKVSHYNEKVLFVSPNGMLFKDDIAESGGLFVPQPINLPKASLLWELAKSKTDTPTHLVKPNYLRITEAEANLQKKKEEGHKS